MIKRKYLYLIGYSFESIVTYELEPSDMADISWNKKEYATTVNGYGSCQYWLDHKISHEIDLKKLEDELLNGDVAKNINGDVKKISIMSFSLIRSA